MAGPPARAVSVSHDQEGGGAEGTSESCGAAGRTIPYRCRGRRGAGGGQGEGQREPDPV